MGGHLAHCPEPAEARALVLNTSSKAGLRPYIYRLEMFLDHHRSLRRAARQVPAPRYSSRWEEQTFYRPRLAPLPHRSDRSDPSRGYHSGRSMTECLRPRACRTRRPVSTAADLSVFAQMMLNGGGIQRRADHQQADVELFTSRSFGHAHWADTAEGDYGSGRYLGPTAYGQPASRHLDVDRPEREMFVILLTTGCTPLVLCVRPSDLGRSRRSFGCCGLSFSTDPSSHRARGASRAIANWLESSPRRASRTRHRRPGTTRSPARPHGAAPALRRDHIEQEKLARQEDHSKKSR